MSRIFCSWRIVIVCLLFVSAGAAMGSSNSTAPDWMRGSGDDLQVRLQGEVKEADGQSATNFRVIAGMSNDQSGQKLNPSIHGSQFTCWVPVNLAANREGLISVWLKATSADGKRIAIRIIAPSELRQAAIDGVSLVLGATSNHIQVKVVDHGRPVKDAIVKADVSYGMAVRAITTSDGTATFDLLPLQELSILTAWTDDHRIGGFTFDRSPPRDPRAPEQVIELTACRPKKIRFVDESNSPVAGVKFVLQIGTAPPNYNFIGTNDESEMMTDAAGEAIYKWFPDWEKAFFYADVKGNAWYPRDDEPTNVDDVAVVTVKKHKPREHIEGHVIANGADTSAGGFCVTLETFQAEQDHHVDRVFTYTDADGRFATDVLPDATYCAFITDSRWVGETIDLVPYDSAKDKTVEPELTLSEGQPLEVLLTSGPDNKPIPNQAINFSRYHNFTWFKDGKSQSGTTGPQWWGTTDESGKVVTRTSRGEMRVSVYSPRWRTEKQLKVHDDEPVKVELHRDVDEMRTVSGRLKIVKDTAKLHHAVIQISSLDDNYEDQQTFSCDDDGTFQFKTSAGSVGIFARTRDGLMAGTLVVDDLSSPIEIELGPVIDYEGQLLGEGAKPVANQKVLAVPRLTGKKRHGTTHSYIYDLESIEATSDQQGNFTLRGLPANTKILAYTKDVTEPGETFYLDNIFLKPGDVQAKIVTHLDRRSNPPKTSAPLAERYKNTLRDCHLNGYQALFIIANGSDRMSEFVNREFLDDEANSDLYPYMQIIVSGGKQTLAGEDTSFIAERGWQLPAEDQFVARVLDSDGRQIDSIEGNAGDTDVPRKVAQFIHKYAPARHDAEEEWKSAFSEAKKSNRNVWVRVSQRHCGPCLLLTRWLGDWQELLSKDYVFLKIDDFRDTGGATAAQRVFRDEEHSIPFCAIFDPNEKLMVDSVGSGGNIGYPSGTEGKLQLRKMLNETRKRLTDVEVEQLVESLGQ